eukprot:746159-Hanusia_phi.AAC.1
MQATGRKRTLRLSGSSVLPAYPGFMRDLDALEHKPLELVHDGLVDGEQLLGDDREHFDVDAVELIEASPGSRHGESLEELPHHDVVHPLLAVEHDTLLRKRLGKVLGRLCLPRPCRSSRRAAERHAEGASEGEVDPVGEGGNNKPHAIPEVLAAIAEAILHLHHEAAVVSAEALGALFPVVPQLGRPLEVPGGLDADLVQILDNVPAMHVERDEGAQRDSLHLAQVRAHELRDVEQLLVAFLVVILELQLFDRLLRLPRPVDLIARQDDLPGPLEHPHRPALLGVVVH